MDIHITPIAAIVQKHETINVDVTQHRHYAKLREYGDFTLAYGGLVQNILEYFETEAGYLPFARKWGYVFALGDPVAPKDKWRSLIQSFIKKFKRPTFVQVSRAVAEVVSDHRKYYINELGHDTHLRLEQYDFSGKSKERLRYAANWLQRRQYQIEEKTADQIPTVDIQQVSAAWHRTRAIKRREVVFMNRPLVSVHEPDVRKFFLYDSEQNLVAFAFFDPLYRHGKIFGYTTAIKRRVPNAPIYAETGLTKLAIEQFKTEGHELITLGLSPLAEMTNQSFRANPLLSISWRYGFNAKWLNRYFYNLQGHAQFKNHFYGEKIKTYFCSPDLFNDLRIIAMLKLMRVF